MIIEVIDETKEYVEVKEQPKGKIIFNFFFFFLKQQLVEFTEPIRPSKEKSSSTHSSSSSYYKTTRSLTKRKKVRVNILDTDAFNADLGSSPRDGGSFIFFF